MGKIALEGMKFYAYHGVYEEEQIIGNHFIVDVYIETSYEEAIADDDIHQTINYETVYLVCQTQMKRKVRLLETLLENIRTNLKHQFNSIQEVTIRIKKLNPIPGHQVSSSSIEETQGYVSECPRCSNPFICYGDDTCWCFDKQIHSGTLESLKTRFSGCLCNDCLTFFAG
ncbi:MAG: dihydroneopterin aldolase [Bacteroidota bacterium]